MKLSPFAIILKAHILYVFDAFKRINNFFLDVISKFETINQKKIKELNKFT